MSTCSVGVMTDYTLSVQRVHRMRSTEVFTGEGCGCDPQVRLNLHMQRNVNTCTY